MSPTADSTTDMPSSLIFSGSAMLRMSATPRNASTTMRAAGGKKMLRQPRVVTISPLTTGAKAGPKVIMQPPMER